MINKLLDALSNFTQTEAVALGGSRASGNDDPKSDYDIYVYCTDRIPVKERDELLGRLCTKYEVGNSYFEYEDNCVLKDGTSADIIYRELDRFAGFVAYVAEKHKAMNGYTTCFWHNLITSKIVYDRKGELEAAQKRFSVDYPDELRENIIKRNLALLCDGMPAYNRQILKAQSRNDIVSVNHRTAAFLESYFDIIFALNRQTHPGEKKLIEICKKQCSLLPENFEENITKLLGDLFIAPENTKKNLDAITGRLKELLEKEGLIDKK